MSEKEDIERATAEGFLTLYNQAFGTDYKIVQMSDAPDVRCTDSCGNRLSLEITVTENQSGEIQAILGRSEAQSFESLCASTERGDPPQFRRFADAPGGRVPTVVDQLVGRLAAKMQKDYGRDVALVVRDSFPGDWDWDEEIPSIRGRLDLSTCPFDRGIWLLSYGKDRLFKIAEQVTDK